MTGDAPQPGETPRNEGNPWSYSDPDTAWFREETTEAATTKDRPSPARRKPAPKAAPKAAATLEPPAVAEHTGEAAVAHAAGAQDVAAALTGEVARKEAPTFEVPDTLAPVEPKIEEKPKVEEKVEHDHDQVDPGRYNADGDGQSYRARNSRRQPEQEATITDLLAAIPREPVPVQERPTVALERGPVPGQPPGGLSRLGRARADRAHADRALQDRVRAERTAALLETSPFWTGEHPIVPAEGAREKLTTVGRPPLKKPPTPRHPAAGLAGLLLLGLIAAFFSWVSAEPFWLAVGHGDQGAVTIARCSGSGVTQRCAGDFTAADGAYRVENLAVLGVEPALRDSGSVTRARMVSSDSRQAYAGETGLLVHLRWALGFVLVLLCGLGIASLTGARRLETARARRAAVLMSMAGPLVLLAGFLFMTF
jgi:hypothetical protein